MYYPSYVNYAARSNYDYTYLIIIVILFILSIVVQSMVKKRYEKYGKVFASSGLTGAEAARKILDMNGAHDTMIAVGSGRNLSDNFNPKNNTINLSPDSYSSRSISAIGVACHEAGHAIQAAKGYGPFKVRMFCIPFASVCSKIAIPLILAGLILSIFATQLKYLALVGILLYAVAVFVQLVTLPVEFDASRRALKHIAECNILTGDELKGAKSVLTAAAMTYVVSTLIAIVQLLRFLSIMNRR